MKMRIQVIIEDESGLTTTAEIVAIERRLSTDLIGISLEEAKALTGSVQRVMVETQAREAIDRGSQCDGRWPVHIGCSRCEPACSINSYVMTSNAGIRSYEPPPIPFAWPRSTRNGPLSHSPATAGANRALRAQVPSWRTPRVLPLNAAPQVRIVGKARISCAAAARL